MALPKLVTSTRKELTLSPILLSLVSKPTSLKSNFRRSALTEISSISSLALALSVSTSTIVSIISNEASKLSSGVQASTHAATFETSKAASAGPNARYPPFLPPTISGNPFESFRNPPLFLRKICSALDVSVSPSSKTT